MPKLAVGAKTLLRFLFPLCIVAVARHRAAKSRVKCAVLIVARSAVSGAEPMMRYDRVRVCPYAYIMANGRIYNIYRYIILLYIMCAYTFVVYYFYVNLARAVAYVTRAHFIRSYNSIIYYKENTPPLHNIESQWAHKYKLLLMLRPSNQAVCDRPRSISIFPIL